MLGAVYHLLSIQAGQDGIVRLSWSISSLHASDEKNRDIATSSTHRYRFIASLLIESS